MRRTAGGSGAGLDAAHVAVAGSERGRKRDLVVLFLVSLLVRAVLLALVQGHDVVMSGDENKYFNRAVAFSESVEALTHGEEISDRQRDRMYARGSWPPLHSLLMATGLHVFGRTQGVARAQQVLLSSVTTLLVYWLALLLVTRRGAFLAGLCHALYPEFGGFAVNLWAETNYVFLLLSATLVWLSLARPRPLARSVGFAVLGGVVLGACILTRVAALPYLGIVPLWLIFVMREGWRRRLLVVAVFVVTTLAALAPWTIAASRVEGRFVPLSTFAGFNLAIGNNPYVPAGFESSWGHLEAMEQLGAHVARAAEEDGIAPDTAARNLAVATIRGDPGGFAARSFQRLLMLSTPDFFLLRSALRLEFPGLPAWIVALLWIGEPILYGGLLAAACLAFLCGAGRIRHAGLPLALVAGGMLPPVLAFGFSRLHLPLLALLLPFSGLGLTCLRERLGVARGIALVAFSTGLLAIFAATMPRVLTRHLFPSIHYHRLVAVADRAFDTRTFCGDRVKLRFGGRWIGREATVAIATEGYVFDDPKIRRPTPDRVRVHPIGSARDTHVDVDVRILDHEAGPLVLRLTLDGALELDIEPLRLEALHTWTQTSVPGIEYMWMGGL